MLAYQSTSFHDALYLRRVLGLRPAPEFEEWLNRMGIFDGFNALNRGVTAPRLLTAINELTREEP
jgi:ethanolamine ammonia-lyase large subunit